MYFFITVYLIKIISFCVGPSDKYVTEDGINCTFLRDLNKYNHKTLNTGSLETLLKDFFVYYSQFDFTKNAICLNEAVTMTKPEFSPMYIVNPLEKGLNVSKNVSMDEVERFKRETRTAAWTLESQENKDLWGILGLLENNMKNANLNFATFTNKQDRLMDISTLFQNDENGNDSTKYKNIGVKKQVEEIKKQTRKQIKALENIKTKR